jgi:ankyrin repeat protein
LIDKGLFQFLQQDNFINDVNIEGYSPLHLSLKKGNFDYAKYLVSIGADVNSNNIKNDENILYDYVKALCSPKLTTQDISSHFRALYQNDKIDFNQENKDGSNILHLVVQYPLGFLATLPGNIDVNKINKNGYTPLHLALITMRNDQHAIKVLKYLLNKGADIGIVNPYTGDTVFHYATPIASMQYNTQTKSPLFYELLLRAKNDNSSISVKTKNFLGLNPLDAFYVNSNNFKKTHYYNDSETVIKHNGLAISDKDIKIFKLDNAVMENLNLISINTENFTKDYLKLSNIINGLTAVIKNYIKVFHGNTETSSPDGRNYKELCFYQQHLRDKIMKIIELIPESYDEQYPNNSSDLLKQNVEILDNHIKENFFKITMISKFTYGAVGKDIMQKIFKDIKLDDIKLPYDMVNYKKFAANHAEARQDQKNSQEQSYISEQNSYNQNIQEFNESNPELLGDVESLFGYCTIQLANQVLGISQGTLVYAFFK